MLQLVKKYTVLLCVTTIVALVVAACANMATPSGGEVDLDPPVVVRSTPGFNATNVKNGEVTIIFDENVTVKNLSENVIITPPQKSFPTIQAANRKVTVKLRDTLKANITYTIDFTDAIVDNNEGNPLENFSYSFSTGDVVDSLAISGKVLAANNLEPIKGIYVGLHSNMNDTAFTKTPFERISRTNESGFFSIKGVAPGRYKLYALDDVNRDYMYDNPAEAIAFMEAIIEPTSESATRNDTTFIPRKTNDPIDAPRLVDTVKTVQYTRFLPDNIVLRAFKSGFQRKFLQNHERRGNQLFIYFGAPTPMAEVEPFNFEKDTDWSILEKYPRNDTLIYWVKDKVINDMDTISLRVTYLKTDSLNQDVFTTDTLKFVDRTRKKDVKEDEKKKKKGKEGEEPEIIFLGLTSNLSSSWDTYKSIELEFSEPIIDSLKSKMSLQMIKDSLFTDVPFELLKDSVNPRKFSIKNKWLYGTEYQIRIDSAAIHSIYGLWNNKLDQKIKVKNEDEYGQQAIWVDGVDSIHSFIELLDKSDKPIRKARVIDNVAVFRDVLPGTYYARITLDTNNNGVWDTGDYEKNLQPEVVCYLPKALEVKANFEHLENDPPWRIDLSTLDKQKPLDITKQKPKDKEARRKQLEEREAREQERNNRNNSNSQDSNDMYNSNNIGTQY